MRAGEADKKYGFRYFDKPPRPDEDEEELEEADEFDLHSCSKNCCDNDCECDDCVRCSTMGVESPEDSNHAVAA